MPTGYGKGLDKSDLLSVSRFAALTDYSVRSLKYLEEKKLLSPYYRDPGNGYRYYSKKQLLQVNVIKMLSYLEFPHNEIRKIIHAKDVAALSRIYHEKYLVLKERVQRQERMLQQLNEKIRSIRGFLSRKSDKALTGEEFEVRYFPERPYLSYRTKGPANPAELKNVFVRMLQENSRIELNRNYETYLIFHDNYLTLNIDSVDLEYAFGVYPEMADEPKFSVIPAGNYLTGQYQRVYPYSLPVYKKMLEYAAMKHYRIKGPVIRYLTMHLRSNEVFENVIHEFQLLIDEPSDVNGQG